MSTTAEGATFAHTGITPFAPIAIIGTISVSLPLQLFQIVATKMDRFQKAFEVTVGIFQSIDHGMCRKILKRLWPNFHPCLTGYTMHIIRMFTLSAMLDQYCP